MDRIEGFDQLYELIDCYLRHIKPTRPQHLHIFLDEISFVREWQRGIKALADEGKLKKATLLLSGSNLMDIGEGAERMPDRRGQLARLDFEKLPMTFGEFLHLTEPKIEQGDIGSLTYHKDLLLHRFREYLITGGFPLSVNLFFSNAQISSYVYQLYLSWIEGDIGRAGKLVRNLYQIMSRILNHMSTGVSWYGLSREAGIASHATVQEYVDILERMYVLRSVPFIDLSSKLAVFTYLGQSVTECKCKLCCIEGFSQISGKLDYLPWFFKYETVIQQGFRTGFISYDLYSSYFKPALRRALIIISFWPVLSPLKRTFAKPSAENSGFILTTSLASA